MTGLQIGICDWDSGLGSRIEIQDWYSEIRIRNWHWVSDQDSGMSFRIRIWDMDLGFGIGVCDFGMGFWIGILD